MNSEMLNLTKVNSAIAQIFEHPYPCISIHKPFDLVVRRDWWWNIYGSLSATKI